MTAGKRTGTEAVAPRRFPSATGGNGHVRRGRVRLGHRPSLASWSHAWIRSCGRNRVVAVGGNHEIEVVDRRALGAIDLDPGPALVARPESRATTSSPDSRRARPTPWRSDHREVVARSTPPPRPGSHQARPTNASMVLSDAIELIRAVPVSRKVRAVGRVKVRANTGSGSAAGAAGATRWRVITRTRRCEAEPDPSR